MTDDYMQMVKKWNEHNKAYGQDKKQQIYQTEG